MRNLPVWSRPEVRRSCGLFPFPENSSNAHGIRRALFRAMRGARHYSELTVWKLADEIRIETLKLTSRPTFARNLKAQTQAEDAVNSICRNIAEDSAARVMANSHGS